MDEGTNCVDIIQGKGGYTLRLGYTAVICRSQRDIQQGKPIREALVSEDSDEEARGGAHPATQ